MANSQWYIIWRINHICNVVNDIVVNGASYSHLKKEPSIVSYTQISLVISCKQWATTSVCLCTRVKCIHISCCWMCIKIALAETQGMQRGREINAKRMMENSLAQWMECVCNLWDATIKHVHSDICVWFAGKICLTIWISKKFNNKSMQNRTHSEGPVINADYTKHSH